MKGNNTISICPTQMFIIVQEWIDRNIVGKPEVTNVKGNNSGFDIFVKEREPKPEAGGT